jgi:curved DNA-binding protein CbpA
MDTEKKNYYEVLEIPTNASPQEIEKAYVRGKNSYSGDSLALYSIMSADECALILNQIEEAYSIIGFADKRREYDKVRGINQNNKIQAPPTRSKEFSYSAPSTSSEVEVPKQEVKPAPTQTTSFQYEDFSNTHQEAKVSKVAALKKFGLEYEEDREFDKKIEETTEYTGSFLKEIRTYKNVSIDRMVEMSRISKTHIVNIENDDYGKLPADVYVRGFVYQIAKCLKLNPDFVANQYLNTLKKLRKK